MDAVLPAGEETQHAAGILFVTWFAEDFVVQENDGIGAEDNIAPATLDSASLFFGHAADKIQRGLTCATDFGHGGRPDDVIDPGREQQFVAARGSGGENQHFRHGSEGENTAAGLKPCAG